MQVEVAGLVDPTPWPSDLEAEFPLDSGWLAQRDPDGSIRADLDQLNQLEDGTISNSDAARLLELRLATAGIVAYLRAAATD